MAVPFVKDTTFADGSGGGTPITAAKLNNIEQGVFDAHLMPAVRVYHNTSPTVLTATHTALPFNSERFDTAGGAASTQHDNVTNNSRLTCRYAGKYQIGAGVEFGTSTAGLFRIVQLRLNGATMIAREVVAPSQNTNLTPVTIYDLAVNDYVEVVVYQDSGSTMTLVSATDYAPLFWMVRVA
jgi:hypothetical protein